MKLKIIFSLLLLTQLLNESITAFGAEPQNLQQTIEEKLDNLRTINEQIGQTQKSIETAQRQQKNLKQELNVLNQSVNQLNLVIKGSEINIGKLNLELESLQGEIGGVEEEISLKRKAIAGLFREWQEKDRENLLIFMLKNRGLAEVFSEIMAIKSLNRKLFAETSRLKVLQLVLNEKLDSQNDKKIKLESENRNLKNRRLILREQKSERANILSQTSSREKIYRQQLTELEKKQRAISDEIDVIEDELRKTFDPSILPVKRPGVLARPIETFRITQKWGERSPLYGGKPHNGLDLGAPLGTPVAAGDDGEVIGLGNNGRYQYGKYIVIKHNNNLATLYAHLSKQIVNVGDSVKRGDLIGYSGNTGYSFGPHLHLGVYWTPSLRFENFPNCRCDLVPIGITIDPLDYL